MQLKFSSDDDDTLDSLLVEPSTALGCVNIASKGASTSVDTVPDDTFVNDWSEDEVMIGTEAVSTDAHDDSKKPVDTNSGEISVHNRWLLDVFAHSGAMGVHFQDEPTVKLLRPCCSSFVDPAITNDEWYFLLIGWAQKTAFWVHATVPEELSDFDTKDLFERLLQILAACKASGCFFSVVLSPAVMASPSKAFDKMLRLASDGDKPDSSKFSSVRHVCIDRCSSLWLSNAPWVLDAIECHVSGEQPGHYNASVCPELGRKIRERWQAMKWDELEPEAMIAKAPANEEEVIAGKLTDIKTGADDREKEDGAYLGGMRNPNKAVAGSVALKAMGR